MEKLIKLLDLYRRENKTEELFGEPGTLVPLTGKDFIMLNRVIIISKEYGFIKWLVENDKIDKKKIDTRLVKYVESHYDEEGYWMENSYEDYELYESLLMLLAISDTPIDDLISYLK